MRSTVIAAACAAFLVGAAPLGPKKPPTPTPTPWTPPKALSAIGVPICTVIAVQTLDAVDSETAKAGDFWRFETVNAVAAQGAVVLPAHTRGWGVVSVSVSAGRQGRAGSLVLEPRYLVLAGGRRLGIVLDRNATDLRESGASENAPAYLGAIPVVGIGAVIGAFDYFHHGKDITVPRGTLFAIFPSDDPAVARCRRPL